MSLKKLLPALSLLLLSAGAVAEQLASPYQVRESVTDDSSREVMLSRALDSLIVRLSADSSAPQLPALAALRQAPQQLVSQFGYESDGSALVVEFDPLSTERALRQVGLPLWGSNRPLVLVWWLQEEVSGSQLISDGQFASAELRGAAQHRGLPIALPLGDLSEQLLEAPELMGADSSALDALAERYLADVQLAVVSALENGQWRAKWVLNVLGKQERGEAQGANTAELADAVMLAVLQRLGPQFMAVPGKVTDLELWIEGADIARFAELERVLDSLDGRLLRIEGQRVVYKVKATPEQIRAQMSLLRLQEIAAVATETVTDGVALEAAALQATQLPVTAETAAAVVAEPAAPVAAPKPAAAETTQLRFRW